jgi:hypothetical protein
MPPNQNPNVRPALAKRNNILFYNIKFNIVVIGDIMRYEIQWFPKTKYSIDKLYKAVRAQKEARDVTKVDAVNRYNPWKSPDNPQSVEFTVYGSYPYEMLMGVNDYLMVATKSPEPQVLSIKAVSTVERKSIKPNPKSKICGCKK